MISIENLSVNFSGEDLFSDVNFVISQKEKIALVGKNGVGKSTLLKIISGIGPSYSGKISYPNNIKIGYLPQTFSKLDKGNIIDVCKTVFSDIIGIETKIQQLSESLSHITDYEADEYTDTIERISHYQNLLEIDDNRNYLGNIEKILLGLGFERKDFTKDITELSGGWRMRIELAKILLSNPDILLLDEPTNHLDIESIYWLEKYIKKTSSAMMIISHDKHFLDSTTTRTIEIEFGKLYDYKTNYSKYINLRNERLAQQTKAYENQQKEIKEYEDFIDRFRYKATKAKQVQSRIKKLEKIEDISIDNIDKRHINVKFLQTSPSGQYPIIIEDLIKKYQDFIVFQNVDITIERGKKIALIGKNGCGKSTLIKCIMGCIDDYDGEIKLGHNLKIGYFAQDHIKELDPNLSIFETIDREATGEIRTKINDILGAFMFGGEVSEKKVGVLSGGELSRLSIIKLLLNPVNMLILDEPTNHLDIASKDILKESIKNFDGTVIIVSHDIDFLDGLVDEVFEFSNKKIIRHIGGIEYWLEKQELGKNDEIQENIQITVTNTGADKYEEDKRKSKERRSIEKNILRVENRIEELENKITSMEQELSTGKEHPETFFHEYNSLKEELDKMMSEWENLNNIFET